MAALKSPLRLDGADPINRGLVGFWPLTDGAGTRARDIGPRRDNGTLTNFGFTASSGWGAGAHGKQLNFDGANDYVTVPHSAAYNIGSTNGLTISLNVYHQSTTAWRGVITKNRETNDGQYIYGVFLNGSTGNWLFQSGVNSFTATTSIATGNWYHLCLVIQKGATFSGYVNGALAGSAVESSNDSTYPLQIGGAPSVGEHFAGGIQGVRVFNRALRPTEVARLYRDPWAGTARTRRTVVYAPSAATTLTPGPGAVTYTGQAVTVRAGATLAVGAGAATYAGQQASVAAGASVAVGAGAVAYQGQLATVSEPITVAVGPGAVEYVGQGVTFSSGVLGGTLRRSRRLMRWDDVPAELAPVVSLAENYADAAEVQRVVDDALLRFARIGARTSLARRATLVDEMRRSVVAAVARAAEQDDEDALMALL